MLRTFKLKMLGVIVIIAVLGMLMQSEQYGRQYVQSALKYVMDNKYDLRAVLARYVQIPGWEDLNTTLPVSSGVVLHKPCEYLDIELHYGWHWDQDEKKNKFNPGIQLKVVENTEVKPIMRGTVVRVASASGGTTVLIQHESNLQSLYGGLSQVMVQEGESIIADTLIGRTGESFYFEVRGDDGPVNPQSIFK